MKLQISTFSIISNFSLYFIEINRFNFFKNLFFSMIGIYPYLLKFIFIETIFLDLKRYKLIQAIEPKIS